jgi:hypothetical protein
MAFNGLLEMRTKECKKNALNETSWSANFNANFGDSGVSGGQCGERLAAVNHGFLDRIHYFFILVARHLSA